MAQVWINPALKKKESSGEEKDSAARKKEDALLKGPQKVSKKFLKKLIENKTATTVVFYDGSSECGKLKWVDNQSVCLDRDGKEMIFDGKNIVYYRC